MHSGAGFSFLGIENGFFSFVRNPGRYAVDWCAWDRLRDGTISAYITVRGLRDFALIGRLIGD